jgi:adenosine deaminase/adenosine deaminase CECR1
MEPVDLFKNLVVAFISADSSQLMAGVNIVSPEDGETSMKDYWLQMVMFKYCHSLTLLLNTRCTRVNLH